MNHQPPVESNPNAYQVKIQWRLISLNQKFTSNSGHMSGVPYTLKTIFAQSSKALKSHKKISRVG